MIDRLEIGTKVRLISTGEVGMVIHTWHDDDLGGQDCYVAFFGEEFPSGKPAEVPYVLRYSPTSLELIDS